MTVCFSSSTPQQRRSQLQITTTLLLARYSSKFIFTSPRYHICRSPSWFPPWPLDHRFNAGVVLQKEFSTSNERHTPEEGVGGIGIEASSMVKCFAHSHDSNYSPSRCSLVTSLFILNNPVLSRKDQRLTNRIRCKPSILNVLYSAVSESGITVSCCDPGHDCQSSCQQCWT
jgi:hypothetical protein